MDSMNNILKKLMQQRLNEAYENLSQEELIRLAKKGDSRAFEKLLADNKDLVDMMARKYFLKSGDYDDTLQVANIAFWDAVSKYDPESNGDFRAFAGMIIKRKFADEIRKENTDSRVLNINHSNLEDTAASDGEGGESTLGDTIASKELNPEEAYLGKEGARALMRFMRDNLSSTEMRAIKLYIKGMKVSKIAEVTGMKYKSVENAIRRVKEKLTDYIRRERQTESKKLTESEDIFSDEEKAVLNSIIGKLELQESVRESFHASKTVKTESVATATKLTESKSVEEILDDAKEQLEYWESESKSYEIKDSEVESCIEILKSFSEELNNLIEDPEVSDEQADKAQDLYDSFIYLASKLEDLPTPEEAADDELYHKNPHAYYGLDRRDFDDF